MHGIAKICVLKNTVGLKPPGVGVRDTCCRGFDVFGVQGLGLYGFTRLPVYSKSFWIYGV